MATMRPSVPSFVTRSCRPMRHGFTLIEILIVVIVLGIIASIVIPQFSNASQESREVTLKDCLRYLRTQVTVYKAQHNDTAPGFPAGNTANTPDDPTFVAQMTQYTDSFGNTSTSQTNVYQFGPYLSQMPANPMNGNAAILVVTGAMPAPDASQPYGWIYNPVTQQIMANLPGSDSAGTPFSSY